ncbi:MAG TPA: thioredoxin [Gemmatimonadaceae bacterium]|nr:thioredoxin [Gemmatimonadaceae bacterium]
MSNPAEHDTIHTAGTAQRTADTDQRHITVRCQFCQTWNRVDSARVPDRPKCGKCARPILLDRPYAVSDDDFQRTITGTELPVLVDFYADWCGPCKMMAPAVDELAKRWQGKALVAKVNTDRAQRTAESFGIRGIPTTIVFRDGKEVARQTGAVPAQALEQMLAKAAA